MTQHQKRKEVNSGGVKLMVIGFLSLCFFPFAQAMDDENREEKNISSYAIEVSNDVTEGNQPCLMGLSNEVLLNISSYLSPGDLVNISEVNWLMYNISYDNKLWESHVLVSQRKGGSYREIFKDLCLNPIIFQFYNESHMPVNFSCGYKCIMGGSIIEKMSNFVWLPHDGLWSLRKNEFPEDVRNSIQASHCVLMPPRAPNLEYNIRIDYKQELPVGSCLNILQEQDFGYVMLAFNKISSLR